MMNKDEYELRKQEIERERREKLADLAKEFALSNNPYSIGDIITDHIGRGEIIEIRATVKVLSGLPECVYSVKNLTKKGTVNKREPIRLIWQSNINRG